MKRKTNGHAVKLVFLDHIVSLHSDWSTTIQIDQEPMMESVVLLCPTTYNTNGKCSKIPQYLQPNPEHYLMH